MRKKENKNPIPMKFIWALVISFAILGLYISIPTDKKDNEKKSFEDLLETNVKTGKVSQTDKIKSIDTKSKETLDKYYEANIKFQKKKKETEQNEVLQTQKETFSDLLIRVKDYPTQTTFALQNLLDELLLYLDYPKGIIKIKETNISQEKAKLHSNYSFAKFDFTDGKLYINKNITYDRTDIIANFVYELNYFNNLARICKSTGFQNFQQIFQDNNITIDEIFWKKAMTYANTDSFYSESYTNALKQSLFQDNNPDLKPYNHFVATVQNSQNALIKSAYNEANTIYSQFNIKPFTNGNENLIENFNKTKQRIRELAIQNPAPNISEEFLFNYFFMKSLLNKSSQYKEQYDSCITKGDITEFWKLFANNFQSFYQYNTPENNEINSLSGLLEETKKLSDKDLTTADIQDIFDYKIFEIASNLTSEQESRELKNSIIRYIKYIKEENIKNPKQELKYLLMIVCLENKLTKDKNNNEISLYYIDIPNEIKTIYGVENKFQKFKPIYENSEFISKLGSGKNSELLEKMLNQSRLNIKY